MKTTQTIDWISSTFKTTMTDVALRDALNFGYKSHQWTASTPRFGYSMCITHPLGHSIMTNPGRPEMGVHVQLGGRALKALADGGVSSDTMLHWTLEMGGRVSRLDLAIDVIGADISIEGLSTCDRVTDAPGSAKKWSIVRGNDGGITLYIGSRTSEKYMRIYDKRAETKTEGEPWTRFEIELKGDAARAAAAQYNALHLDERGGFIQGIMKALFNPSDALYQTVMSAEALKLETPRDASDNTLDWLLQSVAKTLARTIHRRSDVDVWQAFQESVAANIKALENGHALID